MSTTSPSRVAVLGAGAWGTVLGLLLLEAGHEVRLWARRNAHARAMRTAGHNAKALILTRGLAEIVRLGTRLGGELRTFYGLSGVGDMVATGVSAQSRNHLAGVRFARGATLAEMEAERLTVEGVPTVEAVHALAPSLELELPISAEVYRVAFQGKPPGDAIRDLMARDPKPE